MYRIDNNSAATVLPTPEAVGPNVNGFFTRGNPDDGIEATTLSADWCNAVQQELCGLIEAAGLTLSKVTRTQLLQAIDILSQKNARAYAASTTAANTYTATLSPVPAAYTEGMTVFIKFTNHNTGAATINLNSLGAKSIKRLDGSALSTSDISDGMIALLSYDGTNFQLLSSSNYTSITSVQNDSYNYAASTTAANTYTATLSPAPTAYTTGMRVSILFTNANTGAATINLNSLGAKSIKRQDASALQSGDISAGSFANLHYDGTNFQLLNVQNVVRKVSRTIITSSQTYTPPTGLIFADVELVAGGAGGGGAATSGASNAAAAGGGGAGGFSKRLLTYSQIVGAGSAASVTIGAAGNGGSAGNNNGNAGGNSTFIANSGSGTTLLSTNGGALGVGSAAVATNIQPLGSPGTGGSASSGDINISGQSGQYGIIYATYGQGLGGLGGGSQLGRCSSGSTNGAGGAGSGYGAGGQGGSTGNSSATAGGNGTPGVCIITEYCTQ